MADSVQFSWHAPRFLHQPRSSNWYLILWSAVIAIGLVLLALGNITGALLAVVAGITLHIAALRAPDIVEITIDEKGILMNDTNTPFSELRSFAMFEDHEKFDHLIFETKHFFPGHLKIIVSPKIPTPELKKFLENLLPEKEYKEGFADFLARVLKI